MKKVLGQFIVKHSEHNLENFQVIIYEVILSKIQIMAHSKQEPYLSCYSYFHKPLLPPFFFHTICVHNIFQGIKNVHGYKVEKFNIILSLCLVHIMLTIIFYYILKEKSHFNILNADRKSDMFSADSKFTKHNECRLQHMDDAAFNVLISN